MGVWQGGSPGGTLRVACSVLCVGFQTFPRGGYTRRRFILLVKLFLLNGDEILKAAASRVRADSWVALGRAQPRLCFHSITPKSPPGREAAAPHSPLPAPSLGLPVANMESNGITRCRGALHLASACLGQRGLVCHHV